MEENDCALEGTEVEFKYSDADTLMNELAELYSYTEQPEYQLNVKAFEDMMREYKLTPCWQKLDESQKTSVIMKLLDQLEVLNKDVRIMAARCFLYLAQGCFAEIQSDEELAGLAQSNVYLLYDCGVFNAFVDLLNFEIENHSAVTTALRKLTASLADSTDLRVILSVLYIMVEVMRTEYEPETDDIKNRRECFRNELINPIMDELLAVKLLNMTTRFCSGSSPHFPIKKIVLLLWKVILITLGGTEKLRELKKAYREDAQLDPVKEDTMEVVEQMRASSPPANAADFLEANQKKNIRHFRRSLMKQSSLDEPMGLDFNDAPPEQGDDEMREIEERRAMEETGELPQPPSPRPMTPIPTVKDKGLPWTPKVRAIDLDEYLQNTRGKFVGFQIPNDRDSLAGLPLPIHEGVKVLKKHIYTSLSEVQVKREEEIAKNPISRGECDVSQVPTEILYKAMFPNLPQYMIALLKIVLAAAKTSKAKTDSINIMADVLPEVMPMTVLQSMKLSIDIDRHKEIIVKAVSAILLLLLKHFKLNHVYQFEFMSQHLVFANCIPLVLKCFNQNMIEHVVRKKAIPILDFPACVIGDQPDLACDTLEIGGNKLVCWRNMFSCINLLRVLNKLTKWKHSRIMMLVVFKSAPILKRTLRVRHAMMQLYALKLLKMQTKYLGRQWRKTNMKTMSAIYQKVRHRLNDDWAFGNDVDAKPWDFQAEECALRTCVDRFNNRRYGNVSAHPAFDPVDDCITSILGQSVDLTDEFKRNYEMWLQQEVFQTNIDWDQLLQPAEL